MTNTVPWAHWKSILNIVLTDQGLLASNWKQLMKIEAIEYTYGLRWVKEWGCFVAHSVLCTPLVLVLEGCCTWSSTSRSRSILHGNRLAQTADSETIELACSKCQPHFLEDWQTWKQLGIRSAVYCISPSSGYMISFSTSRDIRQRLNCSNQLGTYKTYQKGITMSKGEEIQCCKELIYICSALVALWIYT